MRKRILLPSILISAMMLISSCSNDDDDQQIEIVVEANNLEVSIDENPEINSLIGKVSASTNQGSLKYSITLQTPDNAIAINSDTGEITVLSPELFDYEVNSLIESVVQVSNGNVKDIAEVRININDVDEGVFEGNVVLSTQQEVESFTAENYHTINGDLTINDDPNSTGITSLESLQSLTTVTGVLKIDQMINLLDLWGLDNIVSVGGLTISNNSEILDVNNLSKLTTCNGPILITDNAFLEFYCGLQPLFKSGTFTDTFTATNNMLDPTVDDILNENCDQ